MAEAASKSESMEDILQSIKRIIEDDGVAESPQVPASPPSSQAEVLELTQVIKDDGSIAVLSHLPGKAAAAAAAEPVKPVPVPEPAPVPAPAAASAPIVPKPVEKPAPPKALKIEEGLVSDEVAHAAAAALKPIVDGGHKDYSIPHIPSSALRNGNTVEDLVLEALKPMLKSWLDEHLPLIVQKIVEKEVKRIVTFHND